ncbi:hypothetical protein [Prochlorococcus marinus]|uniref:hypothetical protein n=1 Tax=Prochlorococcus TaxID=1218 RepID=UPI0012DA7BB1|nr:hypothetical protein [Prochlorococcus marinus]
MSGFTPDKEIVVLSDTRKEFDLKSIYNQITDGLTLLDKGVAKLVIPEERAPKTIITTSYTIDATSRSDRRRLWFVPISTFYLEQEELTGKNLLTSITGVSATSTSGTRGSGVPSIRPAFTASTSTSRTVCRSSTTTLVATMC